MEKLTKLNDKIKYVKRIFQMPYHFFYVGPKSNLIGIRFEDKSGKNFCFTAPSMFEAVSAAEKYIQEEIKNGNLKEPESKKKDEDESK